MTKRNLSKATINVASFTWAAKQVLAGTDQNRPYVILRIDAKQAGLETYSDYGVGKNFGFQATDVVLNHPGIAVTVLAEDIRQAAMAAEENQEVVLTYRGTQWPVEIAVDEISDPIAKLAPIDPASIPKTLPVPVPDPQPQPKPKRTRNQKAQSIAPETTPIIAWTTAPADYDQFGTTTLDPTAGTYGDKIIRKVAIQPEHYQYQTDRYGSGLHATATQDTMHRFLDIWTVKGFSKPGKYPSIAFAPSAEVPPVISLPAPKAAPEPIPDVAPMAPQTGQERTDAAVKASVGFAHATNPTSESAPCIDCGTTGGWKDSRGRPMRVGGRCKKCYLKNAAPGLAGRPPAAPRAQSTSSRSGGCNGFAEVGDRLINLAQIAHLRFRGAHSEGSVHHPDTLLLAFVGNDGRELDILGSDARNLYDFLRSGAVSVVPPEETIDAS